MLSPMTLYTTATLMALVALATTVLCVVWTIPALRRRLGQAKVGLTGVPERIGSGLISLGIAASASVAWYGFYCTFTAL